MQEDDLMPLDGQFVGGVPQEPLDQRVERKREQAETLKSKDEIKRVIDHLDARIKERDRISTIGVDILEDPDTHQKRCIVNGMITKALEEEKRLLEGLLETHTR